MHYARQYTVQDNMTAPLLMNALKCSLPMHIREESQTSSAWDFCLLEYGPNIQKSCVHTTCCLLEPVNSSNQGFLTIAILARTQWIYIILDVSCHVGVCLMSFSLSVALAALLSKCLDFYIGLYCQRGNLGQRSVTISTLFLFISLVTSIIRACMHCE